MTIFIFVTDKNHIVQVALTYKWGLLSYDAESPTFSETKSWKATPAGILGCDSGNWDLCNARLILTGFPRGRSLPGYSSYFEKLPLSFGDSVLQLNTARKPITAFKVGDHGTGRNWLYTETRSRREIALGCLKNPIPGIPGERAIPQKERQSELDWIDRQYGDGKLRLNDGELGSSIKWEVKGIC